MKYRQGFVTNSSSSSFIISKKNLDEKQMEAIRRHSYLGQKFNMSWASDSWDIDENDDFIAGNTYMDNFDMRRFLQKIGIPNECVTWGEFSFDLDNFVDKTSTDSGAWRDWLD